jgi:hypothetical protein
MKLLVACTGAAIIAASGQALADGNQLLNWCQIAIQTADAPGVRANNDAFHAGYCSGIVGGVTAMHKFANKSAPPNVHICVPPNVPIAQEVRIVVKFLKDNPKMLNEDEPTLILLSMLDAFPCKAPPAQP